MADFKKQGGTLQGREERYDGFEGEPKAVGGALGGSHHGSHHTGTTGSGYNPGTTGSGVTGSGYGTNDSSRGYGTSGTSTTTGKKPGLVDRLNPLKDTDGDGKKGVFE